MQPNAVYFVFGPKTRKDYKKCNSRVSSEAKIIVSLEVGKKPTHNQHVTNALVRVGFFTFMTSY